MKKLMIILLLSLPLSVFAMEEKKKKKTSHSQEKNNVSKFDIDGDDSAIILDLDKKLDLLEEKISNIGDYLIDLEEIIARNHKVDKAIYLLLQKRDADALILATQYENYQVQKKSKLKPSHTLENQNK